jgi:glycosyltransferase involved in cell wall biosynthesis
MGSSVLLVDLGAVWGGQEVYSKTIADALVSKGIGVTCVSSSEEHAGPGRRHVGCSFAYRDFHKTRRLIEALSAEHSIVHFNGARAVYLSSIAIKHVPFVATKHLSFFDPSEGQLKGVIKREAARLAFHNIDWTICVSETIHKELPRGVRRKAGIIRNGVRDLLDGKNLDKDPGGPIKICFVGRLVAHKGIMRLLYALRILRQLGVSFEAEIAGTGPLESEVVGFINRHHLQDAVRFLGYTRNPAAVYLRSHVCVLPSTYEGLPLSLLEALSCGCALVAHRIPGVVEVIRHGENGIFVDQSEEGLASGLRLLARNADLLRSLIQGARKCYEKEWRVERMIEETLAVYRRVASVHV